MENQEQDVAHIQSEKVKPNAMPDRFPVYLKGTNYAGANKAPNGVIYKFDSPRKFMKTSIVNDSIDIMLRDYPEKVTAHVFDAWMRGSKEYELTTKEEFDQLLLETTNQMMANQ